MQPTPNAAVDELLGDLLARLGRLFGDALVGAYLYGSSVLGDFDPRASDVDLLVATATGLEARLGELAALHADLVRDRPEWDDRIDVTYAPISALASFSSGERRIAFVSPGEPLHLRETGRVWLVNWHLVRESGVTLLGPDPRELIAHTTTEMFVDAVRAHLRGWPEWIAEVDRPGFHAYAVLTICRALYAVRTGRQLSKPRAALWAAREYPQWSELIESALDWRSSQIDRGLGPRSVAFIDFALREARA